MNFMKGWHEEFERELSLIRDPEVQKALRASFPNFDEIIAKHQEDIDNFTNFDDYVEASKRSGLAYFGNATS